MKTPKILPKEHAYAPVKYDVEEVQLKDFDDDEDKQILESIKFAENKTGHKMGTPKVLPKEHAYAPVKYDVEELSQKDFKYVHNTIDGIEKDKGVEAGDCKLEDNECIQKSMQGVKKPSDDASLMTHSRMHYAPYSMPIHVLSQHEDYDDEIHHIDSLAIEHGKNEVKESKSKHTLN